MKRRLKTRKIPKVYSPLDLHKRIDVWHDNEKGNAVSPTAPEPLSPFDLTRTQQNLLIDYLKYSEAFTNTELADYLKIDKKTVARRLRELDEQQALELQEKGFNVWGVIHRLKMTVGYVKRLAAKKGDGYLFLKAELDFIHECQALGIVFEKPQAVELRVLEHSEADEKIIIEHYRRIELGLPIPSGRDTKGEIVELISEVPDK